MSSEGDSFGIKTPAPRVPLSEISLNKYTPFASRESKVKRTVLWMGDASSERDKLDGNNECFNTLPTSAGRVSNFLPVFELEGTNEPKDTIDDFHCILGTTNGETESASEGHKLNTLVIPSDTVYGLNSFKAVEKQPLNSTCSSSVSVTHCLLDDEFDESIFKEIDELCVRSLGGVTTRCVSDENRSSTKDLGQGKKLQFDELPDILKEMDKRNMPKEYLNYLLSLNDRQQEAACSDVSIPLMIVAGPGSGKVSCLFLCSISYVFGT